MTHARGRMLVAHGPSCHTLGLPGILCPLLEFLTVGEMFRLSRALGKVDSLPSDVVYVVARHMGLQMRSTFTMATLSRRMQAGRCVECGMRCACRPVVCATCRMSDTSFRSMVTRADIRRMLAQRGVRRRSEPLVKLWTHGIVKRGRLGTYYYWRKDVEVVLDPKLARQTERA